jgi:hypothetical protein
MARKPASRAAAKTAKPNTAAIAGAAKAAETLAHSLSRGRKSKDGLSIHIHVGDLFLMGFDEAIDAEEWGATEGGQQGASRRKSAGENAEAKQKTRRVLNFRKGDVEITAAEDAKPAGSARSAKRSAKRSARKRPAKRR